MIKKIVVALDGSEVSKKALDFAIDLGEKHSAEILLLTVVEPVSSPMLFFSETDVPAVFPRAVQDYYDDLKKRHENVLSEAFKKVQEQKPKLKISTNIVEGRPADKIIEVSKEECCDLIVIGSRGLGGIKGFFLGSVSDRVADKASCPVLIIK